MVYVGSPCYTACTGFTGLRIRYALGSPGYVEITLFARVTLCVTGSVCNAASTWLACLFRSRTRLHDDDRTSRPVNLRGFGSDVNRIRRLNRTNVRDNKNRLQLNVALSYTRIGGGGGCYTRCGGSYIWVTEATPGVMWKKPRVKYTRRDWMGVWWELYPHRQ